MKPALLILAAGMGSRYGGLKQLDPMGPSGETVLDYSVFDAIRAGFGKVVFVIRKDFADAFKRAIGERFADRIEVRYAYQQLDDLPDGFTPPADRVKPWGTAHAVRAARAQIDAPFAVINADDFYGQDAYHQVARHFAQADPDRLHACMVGYPLVNTLSQHGSVNRGICTATAGNLDSVEEHLEIRREADGGVRGVNPSGERVTLDPNSLVSMNFWGFTPPVFGMIEAAFVTFLESRGGEPRSECYLPAVVDGLIRTDSLSCPLLQTDGEWFGVTYPDDKPAVMQSIAKLVRAGTYPSPLKL